MDGAVPKDGPSAGTAITTALISLASGFSVPSNISMTGEISLNGNVCKIGNIRWGYYNRWSSIEINCFKDIGY